MKHVIFGFGVGLLSASMVMAQSPDDHDRLSLRWLQSDDLRSDALFGDFTLTTDQNDPILLRLGWFGAIGRLHESYADVRLRFGAAYVDMGFPRPAYDGFAPAALMQIMPRLALESAGVSRSRTTHGTMTEPDYLPYGVTVSGAGDLRYAASLHKVPDYDVVILGGGLAGDAGALHLEAAAEVVMADHDITANAKLRASYDLTPDLLAGVGLYQPDANGEATTVELFETWHGSDRIDVTGLLRWSAGDDHSLAAIGGNLHLRPAVDLEFGLAGGQDHWVIELGTTYLF